MKFSELWLREWVNPAIDSDALSNQITMAGLEVDGVEPVSGAFNGVVVGEVVECGQHPNADKLRVTKVNVGGDRLLDIVCGAPNCRQGLKVAVATVGAVLPGDFKIKAAKLRGEPSEGMLCSFSELGISDDHNGIIELVKQQGYVSTEELVEHFSVSPQTIRRDLNELAEQNLILRHHGGAALPSSSVNTPWHDRKATQTEEKERIARKVAEQIPNGSTLFIDIGTTPEAVAHALLNHSNLRIVTNNLNVANTLMVKEDFRIILAGGELRSRDGGIIGEATLDFISQFRLDFGILGISGIDSDGSLLEFDYHEVRTKRAIIENSRHVMLVVDHSKFGRNAMVNMGSISMVDAVYTDAQPPVSVMQVLTDHHIQLELC